MSKTEELLAQALAKRDLANRARRLAEGLLSDGDRSRLLCHASDLEAEASELERQATVPDAIPPMPGQQVVQQQVQVQQQAETPLADNENKKPKA